MEFVVLAFFCGLSAGTIGKLKGSSFWIWFLVGTVLPLIGTIAAIAYRNEHREQRRRCETCGALQPVHVQVCTRCGRDLDFPEQMASGGSRPQTPAARRPAT